MNDWKYCKDELPPKNKIFVFNFYENIGLGRWGQCYTVFKGNSERTHEAYILIIDPQQILDGEDPYEWQDERMIEKELKWMIPEY